MLGFFKRNTKELTSEPKITDEITVDHTRDNPYVDVQSDRAHSQAKHDLRQQVQLFLHQQRLFPSAIGATDEWSEVTFYASNPQYKQAALTLRALQRDGAITVQEPLQWHGYNGWTARVRVND